MKDFPQVLKDCFLHITEITDRERLYKMRNEGIRIDEEGYFVYSFGQNKEYELCVEPIGDEGNYQIALYKNRIPLLLKLPIWAGNRREKQ